MINPLITDAQIARARNGADSKRWPWRGGRWTGRRSQHWPVF